MRMLRTLLAITTFFVAVASSQTTPIKHVVIIVKENRTFDNYFGTFPGARGATTGLLPTGQVIPLKHATDAAFNFGHSFDDSNNAIDGGKMDGWPKVYGCAAPNYACYQQYYQADIPNYWKYAKTFALSDGMFESLSGPSMPNHLYLIASQSAGIISNPQNNPGALYNYWGCDAPSQTIVVKLDPTTLKRSQMFPCVEFATLGDLLDTAKISWKYYTQTTPGAPGYQWSAYDAVNHIRNGPDWQTHVVSFNQFVTDALSGNLPEVSWVMPDNANSEHPPSGVCRGENWSVKEINAVMQGPQWSSTAIFLLWDDFGGFFDHLAPQKLDVYGAGARVPLIIISPYARAATVVHTTYTFDSLLAFVEANWSLQHLTPRDAAAHNMMDAFSFTQKPLAPLVLPQRNCTLVAGASTQISVQAVEQQIQIDTGAHHADTDDDDDK